MIWITLSISRKPTAPMANPMLYLRKMGYNPKPTPAQATDIT